MTIDIAGVGVDEGQSSLMSALLAATTGKLYVGLYTTALTPTKSSVYADFSAQAPAYTTYADKVLAAGALVRDAQGNYRVESPSVLFTVTTPASPVDQVQGAFLYFKVSTGPDVDHVIGYYAFPAPVNLGTALQTIEVSADIVNVMLAGQAAVDS